MLSLHGRPLFPSEGPRARKPLPWLAAAPVIASLAFIAWLVVLLSCEAIR